MDLWLRTTRWGGALEGDWPQGPKCKSLVWGKNIYHQIDFTFSYCTLDCMQAQLRGALNRTWKSDVKQSLKGIFGTRFKTFPRCSHVQSRWYWLELCEDSDWASVFWRTGYLAVYQDFIKYGLKKVLTWCQIGEGSPRTAIEGEIRRVGGEGPCLWRGSSALWGIQIARPSRGPGHVGIRGSIPTGILCEQQRLTPLLFKTRNFETPPRQVCVFVYCLSSLLSSMRYARKRESIKIYSS